MEFYLSSLWFVNDFLRLFVNYEEKYSIRFPRLFFVSFSKCHCLPIFNLERCDAPWISAIMSLCSFFHKSISLSSLVCDHDVLTLTCGRLMRIPGSCLWANKNTAFFTTCPIGYYQRLRDEVKNLLFYSGNLTQFLIQTDSPKR